MAQGQGERRAAERQPSPLAGAFSARATRVPEAFWWTAAAALAWWACTHGRALDSPIDRALPWFALIVIAMAWTVRDTPFSAAIQCGVPALVIVANVIEAGTPRLAAYGAVMAVAFCGALLARGAWPGADDRTRYAVMAIAAIALLRWIVRHDAEPVREALIAVGAVLVVLAFGERQSAVSAFVAVVAALITPGVPARTVIIPFVVALLMYSIARAGRRLAVTRYPRAGMVMVLDIVMLLPVAALIGSFAWSGAVARSLPFFWRQRPDIERRELNFALKPAQRIAIDLPEDSAGLVVSVANGLRLHRGTIVGRIDPGGRIIRMGDVADWGYARREQIWKSSNALPRIPAGVIRGQGYDAWIDGAGWIPLSGGRRITVTADPHLPPAVRLQVESIGVSRR